MSNKPKILYVDDEHDNLLVFETVFRKDFSLTVASSAKEAMEYVKKETFDIILSDQRMPEVTGVEFLRNLHGMGVDAIRILLTGYSEIQAIIDAINHGHVYYYCTKPWVKEQLTALFLKAFEYVSLARRNQKLLVDLSQTVKELETFVYRASHNLETPIMSQRGLLELLRSGSNHDNSALVLKMQESISLLERTIKKMQTLSLSGNSLTGEQFVMNMKSTIDEVCHDFREIIDEKFIHVDVKCVGDGEVFCSDPKLIRNILENILENAFVYTAKSTRPEVKIEANVQVEQGRAVLRIVVEDNGIGIEAGVIHQVLEPFFRGTTISNGSGLGLFVVKKSLTALNGKIDITSNGSSGTRVEVFIPTMSDF